ncbi:MAG: adenylosuccinate lyase, partial [Lachnospiraceae bacterium]|nr:adenylosuccinate lyase [Lachnospiraceae bacterium]
GSSAMPYKRNPMRSERICALSRYLMTGRLSASMTASTQWLERTLDDSAIRRISMPEGFLTADAVLRVSANVTAGLVVNEKIIEKHLRDYMPFLATENILMEAVKRGGDRQKLHELIRECSMEATARMKEGEEPRLLESLAEHRELGFEAAELQGLLDPANYVGRAAEQVEAYVRELLPLLKEAEEGDDAITL